MISRSSIYSSGHPILPLGEVVQFLDYLRKPIKESERTAGPFPYYGANGLQGSIDKFIFDEPLVLLAEDGGHFDDPDRGIAYRISGKTWVNNHAHVLRPGNRIDLDYLCRVLENYDVSPFITGTTRGKLTQAGAAEIPIPLPPLPEQRHIASILDKAEALRTKRRATLARLDTLAESIFLEMFGDPITNPKDWPRRSFEDTCTDETSRSEWLPQGEYLTTGAYPVIDQGKDFIAGYCNDGTKLIKSNLPCVVFGDHTRIIKLVRMPFVVGAQGAKVLVPKAGFLAPYLSSLLPRLPLPDLGYSRHMRELKRLSFPCPPESMQEVFSSRMEAVQRSKDVAIRHLESLGTLFSSLQHRAFRGEL